MDHRATEHKGLNTTDRHPARPTGTHACAPSSCAERHATAPKAVPPTAPQTSHDRCTSKKHEKEAREMKKEAREEAQRSNPASPGIEVQGLVEDLLCVGAWWVSAGSMRVALGLSAPGPRPPAWPTLVWPTPATCDWGVVVRVPPLVCPSGSRPSSGRP
jgi:hypothetical protein